MRVLTTNEVRNVGGGLPFLAPVTLVMLADTGFWGAMGMSFGLGGAIGGAFNWFTHNNQ